MCKSNDLISC